MFTQNEMSSTINRSVTWDHMINQLTGLIQAQDAEYYVEKIMLQAPFHAAIHGSTFFYAVTAK